MTAVSREPQNQRMLAQSGIVPIIRSRKRLFGVLRHFVDVFGGEGLSGSAGRRGA